ncbi:hydroxymethylbilane synthase [Albibacterium indicum]|uniref:hydroxymethylbilane synthase n=1 Tax=Albibacterium indicum TaxID=2292082 RepID=UPI000E52F26A|nr:hydroxymethylbilane synthase [Pedobacter indicus]
MEKTFTIGTRGSELALWQANHIKDRLAEFGYQAELKVIKTQGDHIQHLRLDKLEGKGFFTKELEEELLSGSIDIAVHSHKDLPTTNPPGLIIAAVSEREDPSELLLILKDCVDTKKKLALKHNAIVGTSSNRRKSQLLALRPDLEIEDLRGNINTRIQKLRDENYDAIMIAKAGVERIQIDLSEFHIEVINPTEIVPAPAQGVLAVQINENNEELKEILKKINVEAVQEAIAVERKVLNLFDGGCHLPLGCYCRFENGQFEVWTAMAQTSNHFPDRVFMSAKSTEGLAEKIFDIYTNKERKLPGSVFISRDIDENSYLSKALKKHNITLEGESLIRIYPIINRLDPFILKHVDWIFFNSKNGIENFFSLEPRLSKKTKFAVVGRGSEAMLKQYGREVSYTGQDEGIDTEEIGRAFAAMNPNTTVLFPCAKGSYRTIQSQMTEDIKVIDLPVYETVLADDVSKTNADVLIFTSPSNVDAYFANNLIDPGQKVISIGYSTGKKLEEYGVSYTLPYSPDEIGLAEAVFALSL